ncbi:hypothetical protein [Nocardiopsis ansamitocini]|nr:hypothetical protein [Nocardiopsis ansamitocini]
MTNGTVTWFTGADGSRRIAHRFAVDAQGFRAPAKGIKAETIGLG